MKIIEVSNLEEYNEIINKYSKWLVIISADWCKPCQKSKVFYEEYFKNIDFDNKIIIKINFDNIDDFEGEFEVNKIPLFIIKNNNNIKKEIQTTDENKLREFFNDFCEEKNILDSISYDF